MCVYIEQVLFSDQKLRLGSLVQEVIELSQPTLQKALLKKLIFLFVLNLKC